MGNDSKRYESYIVSSMVFASSYSLTRIVDRRYESKGWFTCSVYRYEYEYLHKNIVFLVIILILKRTFQTDTEIPHAGNQLSFMLLELVFFGCDSQFASHP